MPEGGEAPPAGESTPAHHITIVNREADVHVTAITAADRQVEAIRSQKNWFKKFIFSYTEGFSRNRIIRKTRKALKENNSSHLAEYPIARETIVDTQTTQQAENKAAIEIVNLQEAPHGKIQQVTEAKDLLKELLAREVVLPTVDLNQPLTEQNTQDLLRKFVRNHYNDKDPEVRRTIREVFGTDATESGKRAEFFATDLKDAAEAIRRNLEQDQEAHQDALSYIQANVDIKLANTVWGTATQKQTPTATQAINFLTRHGVPLPDTALSALATIASPITLGQVRKTVSIVGGVLLAPATGGSSIVVGPAVGAALGGILGFVKKGEEENAHRIANLRKIEMNEAPMSSETYAMASVGELLTTPPDPNPQNQRATINGESRNLQELLQAVTEKNTSHNQHLLASRIAEIQTRLAFSTETGKPLIQWEGRGQIQRGRLELIKGIVEGKRMLIQALKDNGIEETVARQELKDMLAINSAAWQQRFTEDIEDKDKAFNQRTLVKKIKHGLTTAILGTTIGEIITAYGENGKFLEEASSPTESALHEIGKRIKKLTQPYLARQQPPLRLLPLSTTNITPGGRMNSNGGEDFLRAA